MRYDFNHARILTCPFCRREKYIRTYLSGNDIGAEIWSDNQRIGPMLPRSSFVQKCPACGKYYTKSGQINDYSEDFLPHYDKEDMTFSEMKEALAQLSVQGFRDTDEEASVRVAFHRAYNDYYYREEKRAVCPEDEELFHDSGLWLIENAITDSILKAEFYREIGEFEMAQSVLDSIEVDGKFKEIVSKIQSRINNKECAVFRIR